MNINYQPIVVPSIYVRRGVVRRVIECTNGRGHSLKAVIQFFETSRRRRPHGLIDAALGGGEGVETTNRQDCGRVGGWRA